MTRKEFEAFLEEFFQWSSPGEKPKAAWLASLESWTQMKYAQEQS